MGDGIGSAREGKGMIGKKMEGKGIINEELRKRKGKKRNNT